MNWTIARRITAALSIELVLLAIVAVVGWRALVTTTSTYEQAMAARRDGVAPALTAESDIRGANVAMLRYLLEPQPAHLALRDSLLLKARASLEHLQQASENGANRERWAQASAVLAQWSLQMNRASTALSAGRRDEALAIRATQFQPLRRQLDGLLRAGVIQEEQHGDSLAARGLAQATSARTMVLAAAILAIFAGIFAAYGLGRSINRPLQETAAVIASSGAEILAATTEQAAGTNESMAAVTETMATVDEVVQTAAQSAERTRAVAESAQRAADAGRTGRVAVEQSVTAMQLVQEQVETMARNIVALAQQAQAIGEITTAVSDIAEQTKLLALNAAVESTRAGEHGRGFALVAAEIKTLAGEAKESTTQVRRLLAEIQRATSAAVMSTEQGTKQTSAAVLQARQAGEIIAQLAVIVDESAQAAAQIGASAGQQALGMDQIRQAIGNIHDATQQSLTATQQSELAAQNLNALGARLVDLVGARGHA